MDSNKLKSEIFKLINEAPDTVLEDLLKYLKTANETSKDNIEFKHNLKKILEEDRKLLQRLSK